MPMETLAALQLKLEALLRSLALLQWLLLFLAVYCGIGLVVQVVGLLAPIVRRRRRS